MGGVAIVAAKVTGSSYLATQSESIVRAPDRPASMASHVSVVVRPGRRGTETGDHDASVAI